MMEGEKFELFPPEAVPKLQFLEQPLSHLSTFLYPFAVL
jgi:hypothetical protein